MPEAELKGLSGYVNQLQNETMEFFLNVFDQKYWLLKGLEPATCCV